MNLNMLRTQDQILLAHTVDNSVAILQTGQGCKLEQILGLGVLVNI